MAREEVEFPAAFLRQVPQFERLLEHVQEWVVQSPSLFGLGIAGAQGTGKTTLSRWLVAELDKRDIRAVRLSIDDLYLTRAERLELAVRVHPLFATRGVPGTHDTQLGLQVFEALSSAGLTDSTELPVFDKAKDDRFPSKRVVVGRPDIVIFEGWCVGCGPQMYLDEPINDLEAREDPDAVWRRHIDEQLDTDYRVLFHKLLDKLIFLAAPDMEAVFEWRWQQECELAARSGGQGTHVMNEFEVRRFIMHYERLTRWMLEDVPHFADAVVGLNKAHDAGVQIR